MELSRKQISIISGLGEHVEREYYAICETCYEDVIPRDKAEGSILILLDSLTTEQLTELLEKKKEVENENAPLA